MSRPARCEVTPERLFHTRRSVLAGLAAAAGAIGFAACARSAGSPRDGDHTSSPPATSLPDAITPEQAANSFNNYYEFSTNKSAVAGLAAGLALSPWVVEIAGLVGSPRSYTVDELVTRFPPVERVERMRCVEGYSMVIPWLGIPLGQVLDAATPAEEARFVRFVALHDPEQMPGQRGRTFQWPYVEGLRLDEARHDLTILATGAYGKPLAPQKGGAIRVVVPWKYGFKSMKALVRIEVVAEQPATFWNTYNPSEYGFYANVNPAVDHPRWSQASEYRVGVGRLPTQMFNGYDEEVASLYAGMDLRENY